MSCVSDVTAEPFVLPTCPANQGTLQVSENWGQRRPVEPAVVVHPAAYRRVHQPSQVLQGPVVPRGGPPRPKRVAQEVELDVLVLALPVAVLAVDDLGLLRVKFQTAFRQARPDRL